MARLLVMVLYCQLARSSGYGPLAVRELDRVAWYSVSSWLVPLVWFSTHTVTRCVSLVLSQVLTRSLRLALSDRLGSLSFRFSSRSWLDSNGSLLGPGSFPYNGSLWIDGSLTHFGSLWQKLAR
jgi:hypothetical protein